MGKKEKCLWEGYDMETFTFAGRDAKVILPKEQEKPANWMMYAEYFWAFPNVAEALLARGWVLIHLENRNRWGTRDDAADRHAFIQKMTKEYGLKEKGVLIGMSCGGLQAIKHAGIYPEDVAALYLDAPAVNLLSCPMGFGTATKDQEVIDECLQALGLTQSQMLAYRDHPLDLLPAMADHRIPVILLYGDADDGVPYAENGYYLEKLYQEKGLPVKVICKHGCGHHPHGLPDPTPIVEFLEHAVETGEGE